MAPKRLKHDQGGAVSSPSRDIFPFMSLPAEIRIHIYKIATSNCICVPYRPRPTFIHSLYCLWCWPGNIKYPDPFPPHVKALLQVKQIRDDMLPHLHLAWVGGFSPMEAAWSSFKHSAIPAVSRLTIGFTRLFRTCGTKLCFHPSELLYWMRWRSQRASRYLWNLHHLTLIEGSRNWPSNPCQIVDALQGSYSPIPGEEEKPEDAEALAKSFPMIEGLRTLRLHLMERPGPVLLDRLSKKCEAHGIELKVTVQETSQVEVEVQ